MTNGATNSSGGGNTQVRESREKVYHSVLKDMGEDVGKLAHK